VALEGFVAVDEDYGDLVVIKPAQFWVGVHVDLTPSETASTMELR
jgi:hypothetical protein